SRLQRCSHRPRHLCLPRHRVLRYSASLPGVTPSRGIRHACEQPARGSANGRSRRRG
ncbi:hypothetical protein FRC10_005629, partial [Ceratobasidium sp. 414]